MKKIFIILFINFFQFNALMAVADIMFIDMNKIINTSKPGKSIFKQLSDIKSRNSNKFEDDAKDIKKRETKLISQKNILSITDFESGIDELKLEIQTYNKNRNKVNKDFEKLKNESTNQLLKLINPILIKYSNEKSLSIILQKKNLIIGKTELDITDEIIKIINNEIEEFRIQ